jgi:hypothetical protein
VNVIQYLHTPVHSVSHIYDMHSHILFFRQTVPGTGTLYDTTQYIVLPTRPAPRAPCIERPRIFGGVEFGVWTDVNIEYSLYLNVNLIVVAIIDTKYKYKNKQSTVTANCNQQSP